MKKTLAKHLIQVTKNNPKIVFLTADLGFNCFEELQQSLGEKFINVGIAEQNMISMAAALAQQGLYPICYSIAPFMVLRALEQIKLDLCLHRFPCCLIGNGSGFSYGLNGPSHHATDDIAILGALPNLKIYSPLSVLSVNSCFDQILHEQSTGYIRLSSYTPEHQLADQHTMHRAIHHIQHGSKRTVVVLGCLANKINFLPGDDVFSITEFPLKNMAEIINSLKLTEKLAIFEDHVAPGGLGEKIIYFLSSKGQFFSFEHIFAPAHYQHFGSEKMHLEEIFNPHNQL